MSSLHISSQEVFGYANQLKTMNQNVQALFHDIQKRMHQIESIWQSPASMRLMEQFQQLDPVFRSYVEALDQYAIFLDQTAQTYQENEQILSQGIQV